MASFRHRRAPVPPRRGGCGAAGCGPGQEVRAASARTRPPPPPPVRQGQIKLGDLGLGRLFTSRTLEATTVPSRTQHPHYPQRGGGRYRLGRHTPPPAAAAGLGVGAGVEEEGGVWGRRGGGGMLAMRD